jgi:hypothetical protein
MSLLMRQIYHETETAFAKLVAVEAMPKFALKVASPSTATPMLIESMIASNVKLLTTVPGPLHPSVRATAAVLPENASVGELVVSKDPDIDPVRSMMPTARFLVALPKPVMSVDGLVRFAVHDLMTPPMHPDIAMFPPTPLIPAICISC